MLLPCLENFRTQLLQIFLHIRSNYEAVFGVSKNIGLALSYHEKSAPFRFKRCRSASFVLSHKSIFCFLFYLRSRALAV